MMRSLAAPALALCCILACGTTHVAGQSPGGGQSDGGNDAGSSGNDAGTAAAITAPAGTWTWIDFPDSSCDDGTPTGIGVNPSATSSHVLLFMNGGGACWDYQTCVALNTSVHGPYGGAQFAAQFGGGSPAAGSILDRSALGATADWNLIARREGAVHQRVKVPPGEFSMNPGSYRADTRGDSRRRSPETKGLEGGLQARRQQRK